MKNEQTIAIIGGGLVAWMLLGGKKKPAAVQPGTVQAQGQDVRRIGAIYPMLETEIRSSVINGYMPSALTLREANFYIKKRRLDADFFPQIVGKSSALEVFQKLAEIDDSIRIKGTGVKFICVFVNKGNRPIDYEVYDKKPSPSTVIKAGLLSVCAGVLIFSLSKATPNFPDMKGYLTQVKSGFETAGIVLLDYIEIVGINYTSAVDLGIFGIGGLEYRLRRGPNMAIPAMNNILEIRDFLKKIIGSKMLMQEICAIIYFDKEHTPIAYSLHSLGSSDATMMDGKIVFGTAAKLGAKGIIISHNHPSGANRPSNPDLAVTDKLLKLANSVGIKLIDHIIVTNSEKYYSFAENGLVPNISGIIGRIGAIYPQIPGEFYECKDGAFTDNGSRRACAWHGGLKDGTPIRNGQGSNFVQDVPLSKINTNPAWFQNREAAYSSRSVEAIVTAVLNGKFVWTNFDPIQLWKGPGGTLYILSGHSRKEAFKRLSDMGLQYQGRSFDTIPAKVETGLSLEEAKEVARQSNTLSTPETALERASYYRRLRQTGEFTMRQLEDQAKRTEGRNAIKVLAFSFLNVGGKTYNALEALQSADAASFGNIETIAQWIGNARKVLPMLTNSHENELYDWLVTGGGYGTKSGQINSEMAFKAELNRIVSKNTMFGAFDQNAPLNIQNARYTSPVEAEFNGQVDALRREIADLEKEKSDKLRRYSKDATPARMAEILAPIEAGIRVKGQELQRLFLRKSELMEAASRQAALFGTRRRA